MRTSQKDDYRKTKISYAKKNNIQVKHSNLQCHIIEHMSKKPNSSK